MGAFNQWPELSDVGKMAKTSDVLPITSYTRIRPIFVTQALA